MFFIGGELGIRTLGGFTLTAFRVMPCITIIVEVNGNYKTYSEVDKSLENAAFSTALLKKARCSNRFEPSRKTAEKLAFWRDLGEILAGWRDVKRDWRDQKACFYHVDHLLLTIKLWMVIPNEKAKQQVPMDS